MGDFYQVIKTIKGHKYLYKQRTFRQGGGVRTESHYLGPAGAGDVARVAAEHQARQLTPNHGQVAATIKRLSNPKYAATKWVQPWGPPDAVNTTFARHDGIDRHLASLGAAVIEHASAPGAFYHAGHDKIVMPQAQRFFSVGKSTAEEAYYGTLLHELAHWTGSADRLGRATVGSGAIRTLEDAETYAREELVAEATAVLVMTKLGLRPRDESQSAIYFQNYLGSIRNKDEALEYVMNESYRAAGYILASPQLTAIKVQYGLL